MALVLTTSSALGGSINTVLVTTNQLDIPYIGTYAAKKLVKLGNYSLPWHQVGKSADIIATLPANIPAGTYTLTLQGATPVSVEIGSVIAGAALNARVDAETARAGNAETGLTNGLNVEVTRATAAEVGLSNSIYAEISRATGTETGLTNSINAEATRAENAEADLANDINATSNNIVANLANNINSISNSVSAGVASSFNAASNNITTGLARNINAVSNSIVSNLTKNFMSAFAFGSQTVSNNVLIPFFSYIGNWTTNGTTFKIPVTGVYQIGFTINVSGSVSPFIAGASIQIVESNDTSTNGLAYYTWDYFADGLVRTVSGQTTVQCLQGDLISAVNTGGAFSFGFGQPTNVPSATLSIIQIQ